MISIIVPTLNEATQIAEALSAARAAAPDAEIIVADGDSSDNTVALALPFAQVVRAPRGRARQMNAGAKEARGDVLLFLHADTRLPPDAAAQIATALGDPAVVAGGFALRFDTQGWLYALIASSTNLRSRLRRVFTGDQAIFVRAAPFRALGGYANIPLMEDVEIWQRLHREGRVVMLRPAVCVSARRHRRDGPLRVVVTGWLYQMLYALGMPPFALHRLYYGRPPE